MQEPQLTEDGIKLEDNPVVSIDEMKSDFHDHLEVFEETDGRVIFADSKGHELNEWARVLGISRDELSQKMHEIANKVNHHRWDHDDPIVFVKENQ